ncbi:uncharacterized protein F4817DRAFT_323233 [Daldinia loculata]|uniref:uncharacterized protein n=1 Tax=Daldinia loculata TaxID=103429 RepID=UPI0020C42B38|nr:uncharacterized protein F4817DRAFT_323233 [Daldinia loculata]KAI1651672.1 hypothetical protein F4817DRAFT_323233 [Daldinia loculata]
MLAACSTYLTGISLLFLEVGGLGMARSSKVLPAPEDLNQSLCRGIWHSVRVPVLSSTELRSSSRQGLTALRRTYAFLPPPAWHYTAYTAYTAYT